MSGGKNGSRNAPGEPVIGREIKKVVVSYDLVSLPPTLIRSFTLLRGKLARKRFRVDVALCPLNRLSDEIDVLFVPDALLEEAQKAVPEAARIAPIDIKKTRQIAFDELLADLEEGTEIYAQRVDNAGGQESKGPRGGVVVRYRGNERIG